MKSSKKQIKTMQAALGRMTAKRQREIRFNVRAMKADLEELRRIRQSVDKLLHSDACVGGAGSMLDGIAVLPGRGGPGPER